MKSMLVLASLLLGLTAEADVAEVVGAAPAKPTSRLLVVRTSLFSGLPDLIGASIAVRPLRALDIEAGVGFMPFVSNAHIRLGPSVPLLDRRDSRGRGWEVEVPLHAGAAVGLVGDDDATVEVGLEIAAGLDATFWIKPRRGLNLRVLGGAGAMVDDFSFYPVTSMTIGAAF